MTLEAGLVRACYPVPPLLGKGRAVSGIRPQRGKQRLGARMDSGLEDESLWAGSDTVVISLKHWSEGMKRGGPTVDLLYDTQQHLLTFLP